MLSPDYLEISMAALGCIVAIVMGARGVLSRGQRRIPLVIALGFCVAILMSILAGILESLLDSAGRLGRHFGEGYGSTVLIFAIPIYWLLIPFGALFYEPRHKD